MGIVMCWRRGHVPNDYCQTIGFVPFFGKETDHLLLFRSYRRWTFLQSFLLTHPTPPLIVFEWDCRVGRVPSRIFSSATTTPPTSCWSRFTRDSVATRHPTLLPFVHSQLTLSLSWTVHSLPLRAKRTPRQNLQEPNTSRPRDRRVSPFTSLQKTSFVGFPFRERINTRGVYCINWTLTSFFVFSWRVWCQVFLFLFHLVCFVFWITLPN